MKRLFTLILAAFVFAFTAPVAMHNAAAQDPATAATDNAMSSDSSAPKTTTHKHKHKKGTHKKHHKKHIGSHSPSTNNQAKTNGVKAQPPTSDTGTGTGQ